MSFSKFKKRKQNKKSTLMSNAPQSPKLPSEEELLISLNEQLQTLNQQEAQSRHQHASAYLGIANTVAQNLLYRHPGEFNHTQAIDVGIAYAKQFEYISSINADKFLESAHVDPRLLENKRQVLEAIEFTRENIKQANEQSNQDPTIDNVVNGKFQHKTASNQIESV